MTAMIDWDQIRQLENDIGPDDLADVIDLFLAEVEEALDQLVGTPPADPADMASGLHFLKGCAYNLGFRTFGTTCADLEVRARKGDVAAINLRDVGARFAASRAEFLRDFAHHSRAAGKGLTRPAGQRDFRNESTASTKALG